MKQIVVTDKGSKAQHARISILGVPANGVIDTGADITIVGGELFDWVAAAAHQRKDFRKSKTPRTYIREPFRLDSCIELDISFNERTMKTSVYVKLDAQDQLLLSGGVCRQVGIVTTPPLLNLQKYLPRIQVTMHWFPRFEYT